MEEYIRQCRSCSLNIKDRRQLRAHEIQCTPDDKRHQCNLCLRRFKTIQTLDVHLGCHMKMKVQGEVSCIYCSEKFPDQLYLQEHLPIHEEYDFEPIVGKGGVRCKCPMCDYVCGGYSVITTHFKKHIGEKTHVCEICNKGFCSTSSLGVHKSVHENKGNYLCRHCGVEFLYAYTKRSHEKKHLDSKGTVNFNCHECGADQKTPEQFAVHYQTHEAEKKFECKFCGRRFISHLKLSRHTLTMHEAESQTEVELNPERLIMKQLEDSKLLDQERAHTGNKLVYICKHCGKKIIGSSHFLSHIRLKHTGEKPFECEICGARYASNKMRKDHQKSHEKKIRTECLDCESVFEDKGSFEQHIKIHPEYLRYKCNICGERFPMAVNLDKHSKRQHKFSIYADHSKGRKSRKPLVVSGNSFTTATSQKHPICEETESMELDFNTNPGQPMDTSANSEEEHFLKDKENQMPSTSKDMLISSDPAHVEFTQMPLSCTLLSESIRASGKLLLVWSKRINADLLAIARSNHFICIASEVKYNSTKGTLGSLTFGSNIFFLTTHGQLNRILKGRHLESLQDLVRLLSQNASGGVTHVVRHANTSVLELLKEESEERIIVSNYISSLSIRLLK